MKRAEPGRPRAVAEPPSSALGSSRGAERGVEKAERYPASTPREERALLGAAPEPGREARGVTSAWSPDHENPDDAAESRGLPSQPRV